MRVGIKTLAGKDIIIDIIIIDNRIIDIICLTFPFVDMVGFRWLISSDGNNGVINKQRY